MTTPAGETPPLAAAAADEAAPGPSYLTHRQILIVLAGVMAGMLLFALDQGIVGTALPRIVSELGGLDRLRGSSPPTCSPRRPRRRCGARSPTCTDAA